MQDGIVTSEDSLAISYKTKHTVCSNKSALWYLCKGVENLGSCQYPRTGVSNSFIHSWQNLKAIICPSVAEWINKLWHLQTVGYLFSAKKKWTFKPWKDVEETWMLSKRSWSEKATGCVIPTIWHSEKDKTVETNREVVASSQEGRDG